MSMKAFMSFIIISDDVMDKVTIVHFYIDETSIELLRQKAGGNSTLTVPLKYHTSLQSNHQKTRVTASPILVIKKASKE